MKDKSMKYGVLMLGFLFFFLRKKKKKAFFLIKLTISVNAVANSLTRKQTNQPTKTHGNTLLFPFASRGQVGNFYMIVSRHMDTHIPLSLLLFPSFPPFLPPALLPFSCLPFSSPNPSPSLSPLSGKSLTEAPFRTMFSTSRPQLEDLLNSRRAERK